MSSPAAVWLGGDQSCCWCPPPRPVRLNHRTPAGDSDLCTLQRAISKQRRLFPGHSGRHLSARRRLFQKEQADGEDS